MTWPEIVFVCGQSVIMSTEWFMALNRRTRVSRWSSVPAVFVVSAFVVAYFGAGMEVAGSMCILIAVAWFIIAWKRSTRREDVR